MDSRLVKLAGGADKVNDFWAGQITAQIRWAESHGVLVLDPDDPDVIERVVQTLYAHDKDRESIDWPEAPDWIRNEYSEAARAVLVALAAGRYEVNETGPWDLGDHEPPSTVTGVVDDSDHDGTDSPLWGRVDGGWKGYKNGDSVYLGWTNLVRRWGPVRHWSTQITPPPPAGSAS